MNKNVSTIQLQGDKMDERLNVKDAVSTQGRTGMSLVVVVDDEYRKRKC